MAMYMADCGMIPLKEWYHDPQIRSRLNLTVAHLLAMNNIIPPDEWAIKYEEGIDYIMKANIIVFVIPYISLLLKDNIKRWGRQTSEEDVNIYKNKYEKEIVKYDYDYIIVPDCGYM